MTEPRVRPAPARIAGGVACVFACATLWLVACTPPSQDLQPGSYRATVETPIGALPFAMDVERSGDGWHLTLVSGESRAAATGVKAEPGHLAATLPGGAVISATVSGGELKGDLTLQQAPGGPRKLPFAAKHGQAWLFYETASTDNVDASGRYAVNFTDEAGRSTRGVAELKQEFERVSGTFRTMEFEHVLAGEVHGEELRLGFFDGRAGRLYVARADERGNFVGESWSSPATRARFVAVRDPDAVLPDASAAGGADTTLPASDPGR